MVVIFVHQATTKTNRVKIIAKIVRMEGIPFFQTKRVIRRVFRAKQVVSITPPEFVLNVPSVNTKTKSVKIHAKTVPLANIKIQAVRRTVKHVV
jgi:hypothetical protein